MHPTASSYRLSVLTLPARQRFDHAGGLLLATSSWQHGMNTLAIVGMPTDPARSNAAMVHLRSTRVTPPR